MCIKYLLFLHFHVEEFDQFLLQIKLYVLEFWTVGPKKHSIWKLDLWLWEIIMGISFSVFLKENLTAKKKQKQNNNQ